VTPRKVPAGRRWKRERCDACGVRDGDKLLCGQMVLVLHLGCCEKAKLCASCIENRRHRHEVDGRVVTA
jgi:hypothetical protein